jgi:hypothetical protein
MKNGYEITLPNRPGQHLSISNEDWRHLSWKEPDKLRAMYQSLDTEVSSKNLLDLKDGGSSNLSYREHNKTHKEDETLNVMHFVHIGSMESLIESIS